MMLPRGHRAVALAGLLGPILVRGSLSATNSTDDPSGEFWPGPGTLQHHIPGTSALAKFSPEHHDVLSRRDCLPNGTNYCFGNSINFCVGCGVCCSDSATRFCCSVGAVCCGRACCSAGQTCNNGLCYAKIETVTTTLQSIVTRTATKVDTMVVVVIEISFVNSIVDVTISNPAATQTEVMLFTSTIVAKRSIPSRLPGEKPVLEGHGRLKGLRACLLRHLQPRRVPRDGSALLPVLVRRQEHSRPLAPPATPTTTLTTVATRTVTSVITLTTTSASTNTVASTVFYTRTIILDAETTVSVTSTTTLISLRPVTSTTILVAPQPSLAPLPAAATSTLSTAPASSGPWPPTSNSTVGPVESAVSRQLSYPLSTTAIAGIAVGSAAFAGLVALGIYVTMACRARRQRRAQEYEDAYYGLTPGGATYGGYGGTAAAPMRQPRMPSLASIQPRFAPDAAAGHHRTYSSFTGTTAATSNAYGSSPKCGAGTAGGPGGGAAANKDLRNSSSASTAATQNVVELGDAGPFEMAADGIPQPSEGGDSATLNATATAVSAIRNGRASSPDSLHHSYLGPLCLPKASGPQRRFFYRDY